MKIRNKGFITGRGIFLTIKGDIDELKDISGILINDLIYSSHYYLKEELVNNTGKVKDSFDLIFPNTKIDALHRFRIGDEVAIVE